MKYRHIIFIALAGLFISLLMVSTSLSYQPLAFLRSAPPSPSLTTTPAYSPNTADTVDKDENAAENANEGVCAVRFEGELLPDQTVLPITGQIGALITLTDLTTTELIAGPVTINGPVSGHFCEGFVELPLSDGVSLASNHLILIESDDGTYDAAVVQADAPPFTPTPYPTPPPVPTATPIGSFLHLEPDCGFPPSIYVTIRGFNWNDQESIFFFWDNILLDTVSAGHGGSFLLRVNRNDATDGVHVITAQSVSTLETVEFTVPCPNVTPTPTIPTQ